jgi:broad specificity phosphatase PhoE
VVRHGATQLNAAGCLRGQVDIPLDAEGEAEADRLGGLFEGVPADMVVTSPLRRARETAAPIAEAVGAAPVVMFRLGDRDYGPWNGASQRDVERRFGSVDRAPGVEPRARFETRVWRGFEVAADRSDKALVVVAHEAVNRIILAAALSRVVDDPDVISQRTGCWNRLEVGADGWSVVVLDAVPGDGREP